jgi:hypothetical protein
MVFRPQRQRHLNEFKEVPMKILRYVTALSAVAVTGILAAAPTSHAAINAMAGIAQQPSEDTCFGNGSGRIVNNCSGVRQFCVATNVTSSGTKTVQVTGMRPNGGTLNCHSVGTTKEGNVNSGTGTVSLGVVDVHTQFTVGNISVPGFGAAYTCCNLSTGALLDTVNITN